MLLYPFEVFDSLSESRNREKSIKMPRFAERGGECPRAARGDGDGFMVLYMSRLSFTSTLEICSCCSSISAGEDIRHTRVHVPDQEHTLKFKIVSSKLRVLLLRQTWSRSEQIQL